MKLKTLKDIKDLKGKRVFLTVDFNISLSNGKVANDTRIVEALPTINYLLENGAKVIIASHLGRPKGYDKTLSIKPVKEVLSKHLNMDVGIVDHFWEKESLDKIKSDTRNILILENIRFYKGEEDNEDDFSRHLSKMADIFVNDAFGTAHRVHASIVGISEFLPSYAGFLMEREVNMLSMALIKPKRPFLVLIGGAKIPEKISVIERLLDVADTVALGGAIASTFLAAWGFGMGRSLVDYEMTEMARIVFWKAARRHSALNLPIDVVISDHKANAKPKVVEFNKLTNDVAIFDIGPKTIKHFNKIISEARTIILNGPMGFQEDKRFQTGTNAVFNAIIKNKKANTIIGGGDTIRNLDNKVKTNPKIHISTGGSAMLKFLQKGSLPGVDVLKK